MRSAIAAAYPRGEETRARIIDVAVNLFAARGFDSVSTREIAAASSVPQASLRYYFENKQGLYIACLDHVRALIFARLEPALADAEALLAVGHADCDRMIDAFCALQEAMFDTMIGGSDGGTAALLLLRHDLPSESGAGNLALDEVAGLRVSAAFAQLIIRISGNHLDGASASRVAGLINGQLAIIYLRRNRLIHDGWEFTPERLQWLKAMIRKHTRASLQAHRPEGDMESRRGQGDDGHEKKGAEALL